MLKHVLNKWELEATRPLWSKGTRGCENCKREALHRSLEGCWSQSNRWRQPSPWIKVWPGHVTILLWAPVFLPTNEGCGNRCSYSDTLCFSMQLTCFSIWTSLLHSRHYGKEGDDFFLRDSHTQKRNFTKKSFILPHLHFVLPFPCFCSAGTGLLSISFYNLIVPGVTACLWEQVPAGTVF